MQLYIKMLGTILLIYTSIINLNSSKFKLKEIAAMIGLAESISLVTLRWGQFVAMFPIVVIPVIFLYKNSKNIVRSISIPVISILISVIADYLLSYVCISLYKVDINLVSHDNSTYWQLLIMEFVLVIILSKLLGTLLNKNTRMWEIELKWNFGVLIIISLILTLIIFYTNIILGNKSGSTDEIIKVNGILFFAYFVLLMIIMYILIRSVTKEIEFKHKQNQFENLQEYTSNLEKLYSDMRAFRHDYINILSSMIGYIESNDMEGLKQHFNEKIMPLGKGMESNNFKIGLLKNIKISEIKGIFSSKLIRAQELGIDTYIDIMEPIEKISIDIIDLSRIVGILLDNAIEAAEKCDKPSMQVAIISKEKSVLIAIINNFNDNIPSVYKVYEKGFSTKGENRGLGLSNLKEVIGVYDNISLDTIIENNEFKQLLEITNR
ncbi:MAG: GHKL domain-containing protein [Bacillota bacterium]|nr:GHKL domain-containing protein [Bacillota bacterium]